MPLCYIEEDISMNNDTNIQERKEKDLAHNFREKMEI